MSENVAVAKVADQAAHQAVLGKLILFTAALAIAPLSSYFISQKYIWNGNATLAAVTAIVAAWVVLIAYIFTSIQEENRSTAEADKQKSQFAESKKTK